jgi:hypothetical protein
VARKSLHTDAIEHQIHPERGSCDHCGRLASQPVRPIRSTLENSRRSMSGALPEPSPVSGRLRLGGEPVELFHLESLFHRWRFDLAP